MILSLIYNKYFYKKSYAEVENIMIDAAKHYYDSHENKKPKNIGEMDSVDVSKLVSSDYMNNIYSYLKNDSNGCDGHVNITKTLNDYRYVPILNCGKKYSKASISDYIKNNSSIVTSGDGLYSLNDELVYRGENVNNLVKFGNNTWRIVKIVDDKLLLIVNNILVDAADNYKPDYCMVNTICNKNLTLWVIYWTYFNVDIAHKNACSISKN